MGDFGKHLRRTLISQSLFPRSNEPSKEVGFFQTFPLIYPFVTDLDCSIIRIICEKDKNGERYGKET